MFNEPVLLEPEYWQYTPVVMLWQVCIEGCNVVVDGIEGCNVLARRYRK